jgi:hypothetical protein
MSTELLVQYAFAVRRNQEHIQKRLLQEIKTASASMADELVQRNMKDTKMLLPKWAFDRIEVVEAQEVVVQKKEDLTPFEGIE